jgi:hypothetical protein
VLLAGGIVFGLWQWELARRPRRVPSRPAEALSDDIIRHALEAAAMGGEQTGKSRWVDEVPGVPLAELSPEQREIFLRAANAERCTCGCGYTLGGCRNFDASCETSLPRVQALFDSVRRGLQGPVASLHARPPAP